MTHWINLRGNIACRDWPAVRNGWAASTDKTRVSCRACMKLAGVGARAPYSPPAVTVAPMRATSVEDVVREFCEAVGADEERTEQLLRETREKLGLT